MFCKVEFILVFFVPIFFLIHNNSQRILADEIAFMHNQLFVRLVIFQVKVIVRTSSFKYLPDFSSCYKLNIEGVLI